MVEQQSDAQYMGKQLEDVHNPPNNNKPREKPGNANKPKPKETASLFGTSVEENGKKKAIGRVKEISLTLSFVNRVDTLLPSAGQ